MKEVYDRYGIILDPHGAVGWRTLELYRSEGKPGSGGYLRDGRPREVPD